MSQVGCFPEAQIWDIVEELLKLIQPSNSLHLASLTPSAGPWINQNELVKFIKGFIILKITPSVRSSNSHGRTDKVLMQIRNRMVEW